MLFFPFCCFCMNGGKKKQSKLPDLMFASYMKQTFIIVGPQQTKSWQIWSQVLKTNDSNFTKRVLGSLVWTFYDCYIHQIRRGWVLSNTCNFHATQVSGVPCRILLQSVD